MFENIIKNKLSLNLHDLIVSNILKAENLIMDSDKGSIKKEYVINAVINEVKTLPLSPQIKLAVTIFGFVLKAFISEQVQETFNQIKDEIKNSQS